MRAKTIDHLQYFVGKICTIILGPINRSFDETTNREHFVIKVQEISEDGIWGTHPFNSQMVSYFSFLHVTSIHEEAVLDPKIPEHARMIKEFEERYGKTLTGDIASPAGCACDAQPDHSRPEMEREGDATFVDIEALSRLAAETKQAYDRLGQTNSRNNQ